MSKKNPTSVSQSKSAKESDSEGSNDGTVDDGNDNDSRSDPGTFDIKYEVTIKKARVDFTLDNTTPFDIFRQKVAAEMGVPLQRLSALGYIVSIWPRSPKPVPRLVDTDVRYEHMIEGLEEYMKVELTTKGQPKKKKPFSVQLIDTGGDDPGKKDGKKVCTV